MDRAFEANPSGSAPTPPGSPLLGYATETGTPTTPGAWWFHMITEEIRAAIVAGGIVPSTAVVNQLAAAIAAAQSNAETFATNLINGLAASGSFVATCPDISGTPTVAVNYARSGHLVTIYSASVPIGGTSINEKLTLIGLPTALWPANDQPSGIMLVGAADTGTNTLSTMGVNSSGVIFFSSVSAWNDPTTGWSPSGLKQAPPFTYTYSLL